MRGELPRDKRKLPVEPWQQEIAKAASEMAGYQGTDLYPPDAGDDQWVIVIHYDDEAALRDWTLASKCLPPFA